MRPDLPGVKNVAWIKNPIDAFVLARLDEEGLKPQPQAESRHADSPALARPHGLAAHVRRGRRLRLQQSPRAYEELVDRLLGSAHYGERMAMDWLDAARYADTNGYQNDFARTMWPWRDWVIDAFNRNQPFDRFIIDQIAGDLVPGSTRSQKVATGFNRNNRTVTEAGSIDEEWRIENCVDRVETTATVFLGLTMGCGRCHDHKYDPITQREFYQFLAFFNSVAEKGVYTEQKGNVPPLISVPDSDQEKDLRRLNNALAAATKARDEAAKGFANRRADWERKQTRRPAAEEPRDWSLRCLLDGSLKFQRPSGPPLDGAWKGTASPSGPKARWGSPFILMARTSRTWSWMADQAWTALIGFPSAPGSRPRAAAPA